MTQMQEAPTPNSDLNLNRDVVSADPALQDFARDVVTNRPDGFYAASKAAKNMLTNLALAHTMAPGAEHYTTADINAEVGLGNEYTMADVEGSLRNPTPVPARGPKASAHPASGAEASSPEHANAPGMPSLAERVRRAKENGGLRVGDMSRVPVGVDDNGVMQYADMRGYREKAAGSDRIKMSEEQSRRSAAAFRRNMNLPPEPGDDELLAKY